MVTTSCLQDDNLPVSLINTTPTATCTAESTPATTGGLHKQGHITTSSQLQPCTASNKNSLLNAPSPVVATAGGFDLKGDASTSNKQGVSQPLYTYSFSASPQRLWQRKCRSSSSLPLALWEKNHEFCHTQCPDKIFVNICLGSLYPGSQILMLLKISKRHLYSAMHHAQIQFSSTFIGTYW